jgi:CHASE2 domain-containing sensor protein
VKEILLRFVTGGVVVSIFSLLGDLLKPKTFAGLFGAAPSVALATLVLTVMKNGKDYASVEARSMMVGAAAFLVYALVVSYLMLRHKWRVLPVTSLTIALWFIVAFGLYYVLGFNA